MSYNDQLTAINAAFGKPSDKEFGLNFSEFAVKVKDGYLGDSLLKAAFYMLSKYVRQEESIRYLMNVHGDWPVLTWWNTEVNHNQADNDLIKLVLDKQDEQ